MTATRAENGELVAEINGTTEAVIGDTELVLG